MNSYSKYSLLVELEEDEPWLGVSGTVLVCLEGHRWGAWPEDEGTSCPKCEGILRIEE